MKTTIQTISVFLIIALSGCDKNESSDDTQRQDTESLWRLEITLNGNPYKDYLYSNDETFEENIYSQESRTRKIMYSWDDSKSIQIKEYYDSVNFIFKIDSIFYDSYKRIDYIIPYWYTDFCNCLYNSNIFILMEYNAQDFLSKLIEYDSTNSHYLTQTFEYDNQNNVIEKYYPLETGLPQYKYEYDSQNSIFHSLNLPLIDETAISQNNITKVTVKQQSMVWDETTGDPIYSTSEYEMYSSDFTYDSLDYPIQEIRYSSSNIDTFKYKKIIVE